MKQKYDMLDSKQETLLLTYQKAQSLEKKNTLESCSLYTRLSKEEFPLKNLSSLRSHLICPNPETLTNIDSEVIKAEPWLKHLDADRELREALLKDTPSQIARAYLRKSQLSDRIKDKTAWLIEARKNAERAKEPKLVEDLSTRLYRIAPRHIPNPTKKEFQRVASDLIYQRQFDQAREFLNRIVADKSASAEEKYQARRLIRNSFKTQQRRDLHIVEAEQLARWAEKNTSKSRLHEAYLILSRAQWTVGDVTSARSSLDRAEKLLKGKVPFDEIYFVRAKMAEERQEYAEAIVAYDLGEKELSARSPFKERILFGKAWALSKLARYDEAVTAYEKLKSQTQDPFETNRASFWLAKSREKAGQKDQAKKELEELTERDPLGYYGLVAYRELNQDIPALRVERFPLSGWNKPKSISDEDHEMARALTFVGEEKLLEGFLNQKTQELKVRRDLDSDDWLYFLKAYARSGLYQPLFVQLGNLPSEIKTTLLTQNPDLLFPRRYYDLISENAEKFNISAELMLSIIRQESSFDPMARSPADAIGLMQVLPSVAREHEKHTGLNIEHFEDLYKPEINIPTGASVLAQLQKKYRGQFVLTAAAYNANERAIEMWLKTRLKEDPLEFIEDIPYEETRAYIKLVLRNFIFYNRLAKPSQSLAFPNWCLDDMQSFKVSTR